MKRASYRDAIAWIAENDSAADEGCMDPEKVGELVSSVLVADIFDVPYLKVGQDVVKYRDKRVMIRARGLIEIAKTEGRLS